MGAFVPRCEADGSFHHTQCHEAVCFCANQLTGEPEAGTEGHVTDFDHIEAVCGSKCMQERVTHSGLLGAARPRCEPDGRYHPAQCVGSVCYCVDRILGGKIKGTEMPIHQADQLEAKCAASNGARVARGEPKGCEKEASEAKATGLVGRFVPRCDEDGRYHPLQCRESVCFCVDRLTGGRIAGTERHVSRHDEAEDLCASSNIQKRERPQSKCEKERDDPAKEGLMGAFRPACEESGAYKVVQCHESVCHCADPISGEVKAATGQHVSNYDKMEAQCMNRMSRCEKARFDAAQKQGHGKFVPQCDDMDMFEKTQCHGSVCFCVDTLNGAQIKGTEASIANIAQVKAACEKPDCLRKREQATKPGAPKPQCDAQRGYYKPVQCRESSCFCVDRVTGAQLGDAVHVSQLGALHDQCMTECEKQQEGTGLRAGDHRLQCDADGAFHNVQCQEAVCACADQATGQMLPGTEKSVGSFRQLERQCRGGPTECKNTRMAFRWSECPDTCTYYRGAGEALIQCCCD